ncbi:MAG: FMN-binding glutamate synthase family protein, partial [Xanthobacteraceae bacterium]
MHALLLPLQPRFIIYTLVVLIAAALGLEFFLGFRSLLIDIPLVVFIALAVVGTVDVLQKRHAV